MFTSLVISSTKFEFSPEKSEQNFNVVAIGVAPGSSEVIAHGNVKNREVQKPLLVTLQDIIENMESRLVIQIKTQLSQTLYPKCLPNQIELK